MTTIATQARSLIEMRDHPAQRQRRKYGNIPTTVDGLHFDSKAEANRWCELRIMEKARLITDLQRQVPYELIPATERPSGGKERSITYIADFLYKRNGITVCEDVKGFSTPEFRIKRKLLLWRHGVEVLETKA